MRIYIDLNGRNDGGVLIGALQGLERSENCYFIASFSSSGGASDICSEVPGSSLDSETN
jgi:hypothetical protein